MNTPLEKKDVHEFSMTPSQRQPSSVLFIHGFCSEIQIPSLRFGRKAGSEFCLYEAQKWRVHVYAWPISKKFTFFQAINPWSYSNLYKEELEKSKEHKTIEELHATIESHAPEVLFAHSMGCALLLRYLEHYGIPMTVKRIIFVQADVSRQLPDVVEQRLRERNMHIENIYCCWDQALLCAIPFHGEGRGGLTGIPSPVVKNKWYPLLKLWNFHTAGLRSEEFYTKICKL